MFQKEANIDESIVVLNDHSDEAIPLRQDAAYNIGSVIKNLKDPKNVIDALLKTLAADPSPAVRRAAAISLGKGRLESSLNNIAQILPEESDETVRCSIILCIGSIGGPEAIETLKGYVPGSEAEDEALRKALDKCTTGQSRKEVLWITPESSALRTAIEVPKGLEKEAIAYCIEKGFPDTSMLTEGLLLVDGSTPLPMLLNEIRCAYGVRFPLAEIQMGGTDRPTVADIEHIMREFLNTWNWKYYIKTDRGILKFRFSIEGSEIARKDYLRILDSVRRSAVISDMADSPSDYDIEIICAVEAMAGPRKRLRLYVKPSFIEDRRFRYRVEDVGASINPVIASLLAHLSYTGPRAIVLDPTCGSGTLLIERYLYRKTRQATGIDISGTANKAMKANLRKAGLLGVIRVAKGNAADLDLWPECDEILANLPFGIRVKNNENLSKLYGEIVRNADSRLKPGGKIVLYTAARKLMEDALNRSRSLSVERHCQVSAGGLVVHIWVLVKTDRR